LPIKEKTLQKKSRWFYYFVIETKDGLVYIRQRQQKDIWADLYEFVLWEADRDLYAGEIEGSEFVRKIFGKRSLTVKYISKLYRQELTHQTIQGRFVKVQVDKPLPSLKGYQLVSKKDMGEYAFPKFINAWLQDPSPVQSLF
jgi:A/G-specific adenine glycosylase